MEVRRSINVFGSIATGADLQPTRREFVCCPGIETHATLNEPNRDRCWHQLFDEAKAKFGDGSLSAQYSAASTVTPDCIAIVTIVTDCPCD